MGGVNNDFLFLSFFFIYDQDDQHTLVKNDRVRENEKVAIWLCV